MNVSDRRGWLVPLILLGVGYCVIGVVFGAFAGWAASSQKVFAWRLAAWVISGIAFAAHIAYERLRLHNSAMVTALHAALAAALGAFGLAVAANIHAHRVGSGNQRLLTSALWAFPLLTAVPAFVVALIVAALLGVLRRRT